MQYQLTSATTPSTSLHDACIASSPHSAQKCLPFCVARQCWWYRNIWLIFCTSTSSRRTRSYARRTIWISLYQSPIVVHCRMRCIVLAEPNQVWVSKCQPNLGQIQFLKLDQSSAFWFADRVSVSALWNAEVQPCLPYKPKDPGFLHNGAEPEGLAYKSVSIVLLDVDGEINPSRSRQRFYALSCITSPGGKHRGLAGSVAVLIAESLLMLTSLYIWGVTQLWPQDLPPNARFPKSIGCIFTIPSFDGNLELREEFSANSNRETLCQSHRSYQPTPYWRWLRMKSPSFRVNWLRSYFARRLSRQSLLGVGDMLQIRTR